MFSKEQIQEHYELFEGYKKKVAELQAGRDKSTRSWLRDFNYNYAGYIWHQMFFEQFAEGEDLGNKEIEREIAVDFGSFNDWKKDFKNAAKTVRPAGWAFLCYNNLNKQLYNISTDSHDQFLYHMVPIVVLDMYEHSYMIDFGVDKDLYIDRFLRSINWNLVKYRLDEARGRIIDF